MSVRIRGLNKHFATGRKALSNVEFDIGAGEMVALIGASGSGKSTLLRHIAGLVQGDPNPGSLIEVNGRCVQRDGVVQRDVRDTRCEIGMVFQQFNLVERLPVLVNVMVGLLHCMPAWRRWTRWFTLEERAQALEALSRVGMLDCQAQRASTLSGGQQQRAAIARTLVQGARVVLADEPIASLDPESSRKVMEILARIHREDGHTVLVSLHQVEMALRYCPRVIALNRGAVVYDGPSGELTPSLLKELYGLQADELLNPTLDPVPNSRELPQSASGAGWSPALANAT